MGSLSATVEAMYNLQCTMYSLQCTINIGVHFWGIFVIMISVPLFELFRGGFVYVT